LEALSGDGKEMLRSRLAQRRIGGEEGFSWRGEDVLRVEGLADAVFGFALTLLVVSLEVPNTFDELIATMRGFFAFAISGWLLYSVWFDHYIFFRRYGLQDNLTLHLSSVLLFVVLFYVYPGRIFVRSCCPANKVIAMAAATCALWCRFRCRAISLLPSLLASLRSS
jgi:hypothetical protein